jgi:hypothetical protein
MEGALQERCPARFILFFPIVQPLHPRLHIRNIAVTDIRPLLTPLYNRGLYKLKLYE